MLLNAGKLKEKKEKKNEKHWKKENLKKRKEGQFSFINSLLEIKQTLRYRKSKA